MGSMRGAGVPETQSPTPRLTLLRHSLGFSGAQLPAARGEVSLTLCSECGMGRPRGDGCGRHFRKHRGLETCLRVK